MTRCPFVPLDSTAGGSQASPCSPRTGCGVTVASRTLCKTAVYVTTKTPICGVGSPYGSTEQQHVLFHAASLLIHIRNISHITATGLEKTTAARLGAVRPLLEWTKDLDVVAPLRWAMEPPYSLFSLHRILHSCITAVPLLAKVHGMIEKSNLLRGTSWKTRTITTGMWKTGNDWTVQKTRMESTEKGGLPFPPCNVNAKSVWLPKLFFIPPEATANMWKSASLAPVRWWMRAAPVRKGNAKLGGGGWGRVDYILDIYLWLWHEKMEALKRNTGISRICRPP